MRAIVGGRGTVNIVGRLTGPGEEMVGCACV